MNVSLSKFCKDRNLSKTSVYRRCQELNLDVSNGLDVGAVAMLEHEFDCQLSQPIRPEVMPQNFIQSGQLVPFESRDIQLPEGFDPSAMVKFFDGVTGQVTDTRSLVAIADLALNAVESAMDQKIGQQRQQLTQAEKDAELLSSKISEAKIKLQVKALESRILAERQTSTTKSAEQLFADLMQLGKPSIDQDS